MSKHRQAGFTLIELLIVVAIIGIIAAIAVPNLLNAMDRAKQTKTMTDIRAIGNACEQYSIDYNFFPIQTSQGSVTGVSGNLTPNYIKVIPDSDAWNHAIQYGTTTGGSSYTVRSLGKDGQKNGAAGGFSDFDCDIIYQGGTFTSFPKGAQT